MGNSLTVRERFGALWDGQHLRRPMWVQDVFIYFDARGCLAWNDTTRFTAFSGGIGDLLDPETVWELGPLPAPGEPEYRDIPVELSDRDKTGWRWQVNLPEGWQYTLTSTELTSDPRFGGYVHVNGKGKKLISFNAAYGYYTLDGEMYINISTDDEMPGRWQPASFIRWRDNSGK